MAFFSQAIENVKKAEPKPPCAQDPRDDGAVDAIAPFEKTHEEASHEPIHDSFLASQQRESPSDTSLLRLDSLDEMDMAESLKILPDKLSENDTIMDMTRGHVVPTIDAPWVSDTGTVQQEIDGRNSRQENGPQDDDRAMNWLTFTQEVQEDAARDSTLDSSLATSQQHTRTTGTGLFRSDSPEDAQRGKRQRRLPAKMDRRRVVPRDDHPESTEEEDSALLEKRGLNSNLMSSDEIAKSLPGQAVAPVKSRVATVQHQGANGKSSSLKRKMRQQTEGAKGKKWTASERSILLEQRAKGVGWERIAERLPGRSEGACKQCYQKIKGKKRNRKPRWTPEDVRLVKASHLSSFPGK